MAHNITAAFYNRSLPLTLTLLPREEEEDEQGQGRTDRQTDRHADRQAGRWAGRQAGRQEGRQASRQAGRQAGRPIDRQTEIDRLRQTRQRDRDIYTDTETNDKDKDKEKDKDKDKDNDKDKKNRKNKNPHPSVHRAALQRRKQWLSGSYSSPCAKSDSCRERCSRALTRGALSTGAGCPRVSAVWFFVLIVWSTGRQTTRRKNGQNGQPPSGALFLHIGVLHTLEEAPFE